MTPLNREITAEEQEVEPAKETETAEEPTTEEIMDKEKRNVGLWWFAMVILIIALVVYLFVAKKYKAKKK